MLYYYIYLRVEEIGSEWLSDLPEVTQLTGSGACWELNPLGSKHAHHAACLSDWPTLQVRPNIAKQLKKTLTMFPKIGK